VTRALALVLAALALGGGAPVEGAAAGALPQDGGRAVDFRRDVYPLLQARCFKCHSGAAPKSGTRLDFLPEILGETTGRPLAVPGRSEESRLVQLAAGALGDDSRMPPQGKRLTAEEIGVLRAWVDQGLAWDDALLPPTVASDHWAFRPVRRPPVPSGGGRTPVDAFLEAAMRARGVRPRPEAPRPVLLRRLSLDLTGLPPEPDEVRAFVEDRSPDAYEKVVERLLASPHYGERWGRHWLDVARFAESEGYESNHPRPYAWRYRDYVVESFNADKPFDRFLREQLAGDEIEPYSDENLIATGFLAAARLSSNEEDKALQRNDVLVDVVNATAQAFLGLTLGCAQCHNHKFDPVSQRDYYRLQAFFVKGQPTNVVLRDPPLWEEFHARKAPEYEALVRLKRVLFERGRARFIEEARARFAPETLEALAVPDARRTPRQYELARQADLAFQATPEGYEARIPEADKKLYAEAKKRLAELKKSMADEPQAWAFYSPATSPHALDVLPVIGFYPLPYEPEELGRAAAYLRVRGEVHQRGPALTPGWPAVFGRTPPIGAKPRTALADWLTGPTNPLVARVWVNRVWHYHFGRGLVETPGDFGLKGAPPDHPGLLDWLASELVEGGWSTKHVHRRIVRSAAYRRDSRPDPSNAAVDPDNRLLWRRTPRRLEAEALRDSLLAVSGELDRRRGGPSTPPEKAADSRRRTIYFMQKRDAFPEFHSVFDGPSANESCARRHVSTVALQPLLLLNDPFVAARARGFAERVRGRAGTGAAARVEAAFELALGRAPDDREREAGAAFLEGGEERLVLFCQVLFNLNEFAYVP
jgi:hypothetical protein